jgi:subtilisin family serine protease
MKVSRVTALFVVTIALSIATTTADAQQSVSASEAENTTLWFVELAGRPVADGGNLANVQAEKAAFRQAAAAAGVKYRERRAYDVLFNGLAVEVERGQRQALAAIPNVRALWPIEIIQAPEFDAVPTELPDLQTAIAMTGADMVQNSLGITGQGIRVAVMDTGIDYDHPDFGGNGVPRTNSTSFPNERVVAGWDFVGDSFDNSVNLVPTPDPFPDDCGGHGTHVAGIVGASGGITGVAPGVTFGSYRVFGCTGSTTADIMLEAMERALKDKMDVLNMSIGSRGQWPEYPTGAAATRLLAKGMVVVASIGNNGPGASAPDGPYAAGAPGVGHDVIGVASFDNTHLRLPFFTVNGTNVGYQTMTFSIAAPTSGTEEIVHVGRGCADGNLTLPGPQPDPYLADPNGKVALIERGVCGFAEKATRAIAAGATAVVVYNNVPGVVSGTLGAPLADPRPVVGISQAHGQFIRAQAAPIMMTWTNQNDSFPNPTGGLISGFSSFGMAADLTLKPDIGAPGGLINSTIPLEQGAYGTNSGTSMSSPHVAGAVALLLASDPSISLEMVRDRLLNSARPQVWSGNPGLGFLDFAHRQGAGMLDIEDAILATVDVTPAKLSLGESEAGPQTRTLTITNRGSSDVTLNLSHAPALATGPKSQTNYATVSAFNAPATVAFGAGSVTVPAGGSATVNVIITAPTTPNLGQYGGYIVLTPQGGGRLARVAYAGFVGDYQLVPVLTPTANGFPWLAKLNAAGTTFTNQPGGATYTMAGNDIPFFLVHLDHQSRRYEFAIYNANNGKAVHPVFNRFDEDEFVGRNSTAGGFFAFEWDGTRAHSNGNKDLRKTVPDGSYRIVLRVLKALGDPNNPAHWETWTSPVVTIDRP